MHYYQFLIDKLDLKSSDYLLDYGCGSGKLLEYLYKIPGKIIAVDADQSQINIAKQRLNNSKIEFRQCTSPSELADKVTAPKFDKIICHNVLECVMNKVGFINEFIPLLESSGWLVLSHFDFDSGIYNSSYKEFTRDLIHNFADSTANWQTNSDGQIGRKMLGLIKSSNFKNYNWRVMRLAEDSFTQNNYGYLFAQMLIAFGKKIYSDKKLEDWYKNLEALALERSYFFAIDLFIGVLKI